MEKNQKKLQTFFFKLRKNSSTLTVISFFFLFSLFSFLLTFNDGFYQIFFNQFNHLKHFLNKKAVFFFFNAILLFLAKSSGLLATSVEQPVRLPASDSSEKTQLSPAKKLDMEGKSKPFPAGKMIVKERKQLLLEVRREVEKKKPGLMEGDCISEEEEEEEEVGGEMEELGIDELNKKCEEFILRFRKEIKMEALQMVMV